MDLAGLTGALANFIRGEVAKQYNIASSETIAQIRSHFPIKNGLMVDMAHIPQRINHLREEVIEKRKTLRTVRQVLADRDQELKEVEANLLADIMTETLENGKPRFSNDKARAAELMKLKKVDPDYQHALYLLQDARSETESLEDEIASLEAEVKTKEMEFQGALRLLENTNQEMAIFAAMMKSGGGDGCKCKTHTIDNHGAEESKETDANFSKEERSW